MNAAILSIGDELVLGQNLDTNAQYLSRHLVSIGCHVVRHQTVGDDERAIHSAIDCARSVADVILITGGLGPTADDLTRHAIASVMKVELKLDSAWLDHVRAFFAGLGREMPESNRIQAMIPEGAKLIWNHNGTAAGIRATLNGSATGGASTASSDSRKVELFAMPGVPKEMKLMLERDVLPVLAKMSGGRTIASRALHSFGAGESTVAELLGDLMKRDRNPTVGTTVSSGIVTIRINARAEHPDAARKSLADTESAVRAKLGDLIWGSDDQTLPEVVADLLRHGLADTIQADEGTEATTVSTAESCTGGLLAQYLTSVPGSSTYFHQGWVTYTNLSKTMCLNVDPHIIERNGAVSEPTVRAMAEQARALADSDIGIAISGIAGPGGATHDKPVGTVFIALAAPRHTVARRFVFPGDRATIRDRAAKTALAMLRFHLIDRPMPF